MAGNVWFISGATSGFGKHIALEALSRGDSVVATSRNATTKLSSLCSPGAPLLLLIDLDVTAPDEAIAAAFRQAKDKFGRISHFVNAAGYVLEGPVEGASQRDVFDTFNVNVLGNLHLSRLEIKLLREQGTGGAIANFGSLASLRGGPGYAYYAATKWAISGFTEGLAAEAKDFGLSAVVIEPGYFRTGFLNTGGGNRLLVSDPMDETYKGTSVEFVRGMLDQVNDNQPGDVAKGAKVIVDVLTKTGAGAGKAIPTRLLLGSDTVKGVKDKITQLQELLKEQEALAVSTDYDDTKNA
ncbi:hypothetical protein BJ170DRAFT_410125 [Xylariales sp. AK1849]|nr:hypothetical protein BJ170DRAFT_410125 [Xylariales sp. AK1849]